MNEPLIVNERMVPFWDTTEHITEATAEASGELKTP